MSFKIVYCISRLNPVTRYVEESPAILLQGLYCTVLYVMCGQNSSRTCIWVMTRSGVLTYVGDPLHSGYTVYSIQYIVYSIWSL